MNRIRIFQYMPQVDAFDVTADYPDLANDLGLSEWNPVVWIGRLFLMDNDYGEHWFDNWGAREDREEVAAKHELQANDLLVIDPERFQNGHDGPCNSAEFRGRFWHDVFVSLELSSEVLF